MDGHALRQYLQPGEILLEMTRPAMWPTLMQVFKVLFWGTLAATFLWSLTGSFPLAWLYGLGLAALVFVGPLLLHALSVTVAITDRRVLVLKDFVGQNLSQVDIDAIDTVELDVGLVDGWLDLGTLRMSGPGVSLQLERMVGPKRLVDACYHVRHARCSQKGDQD